MTGTPTVRQQQKARSRQKILDAASARLLTGGPGNVVIKAVTADAGLTHGAFYAHFRNKEELTGAAFENAIERGQSAWFADADLAEDFAGRLSRLADSFLSRRHRDNRAEGCALAALASELAHAPASLKTRYAQAVERTVHKIAESTPENLDAAIEFLASMTGAINMARNSTDPALSDQVLRVAAARFSPCNRSTRSPRAEQTDPKRRQPRL